VTKPRIGINLLWLLPDAAGGAEEYAIRLLRALDEVAADGPDITLLCNRRFPAAHPELARRSRIAVAPVDGGSRAARIVAESTWLLREAAKARLHLVHHLNNVVPWLRNRPSVLTIHDLRPLVLPGTLGRAHGAYLRARLGPSVRRASVITTPSVFVRETVIDLLGADPERVRVVSAPLFVADARDGSGDVPAGTTAGTSARGRHFLYPAITDPHKNHRTLLEAFAKVIAVREDAVLVLTGAPGPAEDAVTSAIDVLGLTTKVRRLGRVPLDELDALFRDAVALVYPSVYEGFGLPLAEAMAMGCPVIASDRTALPEVVGDAGILLNPDDVDGWADAMLRLLGDESLRAELIAAGRERARALTPEEAARRQVDVYRLALEEPRRRAAS
jgi:glycosyltransferase involved in cell wall biosynthesis